VEEERHNAPLVLASVEVNYHATDHDHGQQQAAEVDRSLSNLHCVVSRYGSY
jgi:hypothetical protein